jgi:hypothetical protein
LQERIRGPAICTALARKASALLIGFIHPTQN